MCERICPHDLPLLPGYSFKDNKKINFHKSQCFDYKFGVANDTKIYVPAAGNRERDIDSIQFYNIEPENPYFDPELTYGKPKNPLIRPFRPHYVTYDRSCLRFRGYFQQEAFNSPDESHRIRVVELLYFLEDDTVTIIEPEIPNSGLPQGRLVRRSRIPQGPLPDCPYLHWKDLNLGRDIYICGFDIRLVDCDTFTAQFLESQGVEMNSSEPIPMDDFNKRKFQQETIAERPTTAHHQFKLKQFLLYDGIVLKFRAVWDAEGDKSSYGVCYFLSDDTIQITEIHDKNDGKDPFPILLKRTRLPKAWDKVPLTYPSIVEESALEVTEFYQPKDLIVGDRIVVLGRDMLIHMCDDFTRNYYKTHFNITQPDNFSVAKPKTPPPQKVLPPYTGFGSLEDSLQSCLTFTMKSPRRDIVRKIVNANRFLRYKMILCSAHPEDAGREFVLSYSLADGSLTINEPPQRNTGHVGGRFLSNMRVSKPGSSPDYPEYYTPQDFYIDNIVVVNEFRFKIIGADLHVYNYMQDNQEKFRPEVIESVKKYIQEEGLVSSTN